MPFYEYECPHCGYDEEVLQKINDKPLKKCPSCGKKGLRKLMSAPVFRLKGSGWYETDFKGDKENKRNLAGADKEEAKSRSQDGSQGRRQDRREAGRPKPKQDRGAEAGGRKGQQAAPASPRRSEGQAQVQTRAHGKAPGAQISPP